MSQRSMSASDATRRMDVPIVKPFTRRSLLWFAVLLGLSAVMIQLTWYVVPWFVIKFMAPNTIKIAHATYDGSCGPKDVTEIVAQHCEGRPSCNITFNSGILEDVRNTCLADFAASWTCGGNAHDLKIDNAGPKSIASITCPVDAREAVR